MDISGIDGAVGIVHKVLTAHENPRMRRLSHLKNGAAIICMLSARIVVGDDEGDDSVAVVATTTATENRGQKRKGVS